MRLKTYTVNTLPEGMLQIKKDLGEDALILNTKKVKTRGFFGFFRKEKLEIIAAVETQANVRGREQQGKVGASDVRCETNLLGEREDSVRPSNVRWQGNVMEEQDERERPSDVRREANLLGDREARMRFSEVRRQTHVLDDHEEVVATKVQFPKQDERLTSDLMNELKDLKNMMVQVMEEDSKLPEAVRNIHAQFVRQEISSEIRSEWLAKLMLFVNQNPGATSKQVDQLARKQVVNFLTTHQKLPETKKSEMICFVGPTGVGKTTTIAKIAADYLLNENKKVGLITSDTYRIAAVEQLKTYAGILNIPIQVVQSPADMQQALTALNDCDVILMDTAGRNYQQQQYMNELELLLSDKEIIQINLVLSLTSKYEDMKNIIESFQSIHVDQLILTKKDETSSFGAIVNLLYEYDLPLRYITTGQNVPDDIVEVTPELLANFLLGESFE